MTFDVRDGSNVYMRRRVWLQRAAMLMLLALALVPVDSMLHGHDGDAHGDDHCAVCHVRHLSFVETPAPPSTPVPAGREDATPAEVFSSILDRALSLHPSRGPPI